MHNSDAFIFDVDLACFLQDILIGGGQRLLHWFFVNIVLALKQHSLEIIATRYVHKKPYQVVGPIGI